MAEVPPGVVTRTSTGPAGWTGRVTRTWVAERRVRPVAAAYPKWTELARCRPVPLRVTVDPPPVEPLRDERAPRVGTASKEKVDREDTGEEPVGVATRTLTRPAAWAGVTTRTFVVDRRVTRVTVVVPKRTFVVAPTPEPDRSTTVPPRVGPATTDRLTADGAVSAAAGAAPARPGMP